MRTRAELRGRWRSSVLMVALIGLAGGVALTAAAGARRTDTAYPRYLQATHSEDFLVSAFFDGSAVYPEIAKLPQVERSGRVDGLPLVYSPKPGVFDPNVGVLGSHDGKAGYTITKLHMLSGRPPDPTHANEVAVSLTFQRQFHVGTGDRIQLYRVDAQSGKPVLGPDG